MKSPPPPDRQNLRVWGLCALITLSGLVAYGNSFSGAFVFDDLRTIFDNRAIRSLWPIGPLVADTSRPVVLVSLAVNYFFGETNVFGYHLFNVSIHLLAGLVLFGLVRRTLMLVPRYAAERVATDRLAFAAAVVWLVHPLGTESVTYIIQRSESMMGLFYLLCLYCVLRGAGAARSWPWYVGAVAACWLGMGTKQVMFTAPLVVLLYDRIFLAESWKEIMRRRWAVYGAFVVAQGWLVTMTFAAAARTERASAGFSMEGVTPLEYLGSQAGVILFYLRLAVWPDPLCLDYWWQSPDTWAGILLPGAVVTALVVASFVALRYCPRLGFVGLSFFLVLAPSSSIMPINDPAAEHRMYLPLAALVVLLVLGWDRLSRRFVPALQARRALGFALLGIVVLSLTLRTIDRNRDYRDLKSTWTHVLEVAPQNARAQYNLGTVYGKENDFDNAIAHFEQALRLKSDFAEVYSNLGLVLEKQGRHAEAIARYEQALQLKPDFAEAHLNFGVVLERLQKVSEAVRHYLEALRIKPDYPEAHINLAVILGQQGDFAGSANRYEAAIRLRPDDADLHSNLGNMQIRLGKLDEAVTSFERALELRPDFADAHNNFAVALTSQEKFAEAAAHVQRGLEIKPDDVKALQNLAVIWIRQGDFARAVDPLEEAIRLAPDDASVYVRLADVHERLGSPREAIDRLRQALRLQPGFVQAATKLCWILATSHDATVRNGPQAVGLAEQLAAATGRKDPTVLDALAAAYAEVGRWDEATRAAQEATSLAKAAGQSELVGQIDARLGLYRQQKPFRSGP